MRPVSFDPRERDISWAIQGRYAAQARLLLREEGVHVCRLHTTMSGRAWLQHPARPIEVPQPRSPLAFMVLALLVGHQVYRGCSDRSEARHQAWQFAFSQMTRFDIPVPAALLLACTTSTHAVTTTAR